MEYLDYDQFLEKFFPEWRQVPCSGWDDPHEMWTHAHNRYLKDVESCKQNRTLNKFYTNYWNIFEQCN